MQVNDVYNFCWINIRLPNIRAEKALRDQQSTAFYWITVIASSLISLSPPGPLQFSLVAIASDFLKNTHKLISVSCLGIQWYLISLIIKSFSQPMRLQMSKDIGARPRSLFSSHYHQHQHLRAMLHCSPGSLHMLPLPLLGYLELLPH